MPNLRELIRALVEAARQMTPKERMAFTRLKMLKVPPDILRTEFPWEGTDRELDSLLVFLDAVEDAAGDWDAKAAQNVYRTMPPRTRELIDLLRTDDIAASPGKMDVRGPDVEEPGAGHAAADVTGTPELVSSPVLLWLGYTLFTAQHYGPGLTPRYDEYMSGGEVYGGGGFDVDPAEQQSRNELVQEVLGTIRSNGWDVHSMNPGTSRDYLLFDPRHWKQVTREQLMKMPPTDRIYGVEATGLGTNDLWLYPKSRQARYLARIALSELLVGFNMGRRFEPYDDGPRFDDEGEPRGRWVQGVSYSDPFYKNMKDMVKRFADPGWYHLSAGNIFTAFEASHPRLHAQQIGERVLGLTDVPNHEEVFDRYRE